MTPEGWMLCTLKDAADIVGGFAFPHVHQGRAGGPYPFFKVSDMNRPGNELRLVTAENTVDNEALRSLRARVFPSGTVVFPKVGAALLTNKRRLLGREGLFDNNVMGLVPSRSHGPFVYYFMQTVDFASMVQPGAVPSVNGTMVGGIPILLPPLPEQRKIAAILSSVDDAIESTQAVIDQLGVVKKAMMAELLTRGLPGRHTRFKQTEIGEVPEEWEVAPLGGYLREPIRNGYSPVCPTTPTGRWILHLGAVTFEGFNSGAVKPAPLHDSRVDGALVERGDLMMSRANTRERVGLVGLYRGIPERVAYPDLMMRLRVSAGLLAEFLELVLLNERSRAYLSGAARGTSESMVKINRDIVGALLLQVPRLDEQREIVAAIDAVRDRRDAEVATLNALRSLKSSLMSVLLTGEVRVKPDEDAA